MTEVAPATSDLHQRLDAVRRRIEECARLSNRAPEEITLIAVSKTHEAETVERAIAAGVRDLGENRVQEAEEKIRELGRERARWHLIGHLQANKARRAVQLFDLIHSIDSSSLVERLERLCVEEERAELPVLIQVDLAGEETKSGVSTEELPDVVATVTACARVRLKGLMTLPPLFEEVERVRPYFQRLRELRDRIAARNGFGANADGELSMGMSHDYHIAIEEGATMVRVGTSIFGERRKSKDEGGRMK